MDDLLRLQNLDFAYNRASKVLDGLNLSLASGERIWIQGENGAGKSTLFRCITGLEKLTGGKIYLDGREIRKEKDFTTLRRSVGYILQNSEDQLFFPAVLEDVSFGPANLGLDEDAAKARARETLKLLGIEHLAMRNSVNLSGGEQKLAAIAAIFAMQPRLLLLDEPFNGLDSEKSCRLTSILNNMNCSMLMATHETYLATRLKMREYILKAGKLAAASC